MDTSYLRWIWHGEGVGSSVLMNFNGATLGVRIDDSDDVIGIVNDIEKDVVDWHEQFERLLGDIEKPLYFGCTNNFTMLSAIVHLHNLKAGNVWSNKSFLDLLCGDAPSTK